jgi:hypothetical protein
MAGVSATGSQALSAAPFWLSFKLKINGQEERTICQKGISRRQVERLNFNGDEALPHQTPRI